MLVAALVFAGCQALVLCCSGYLALKICRREVSRVRDEASEMLAEFLTSPDKDTPSPFAALLDQAALLLAARLVQQVKAMLAGVESGVSKGEQLAMMEEVKAGSPWLSLIAGMLPRRLQKQLLSNPQMIGALSRLGGGSNHQSTADSPPARRHRE